LRDKFSPQGLDPESTWAHALSKPLQKLAVSLKRRSFPVAGKVSQLPARISII
jgi:hypothetical protein